MLGLVKSLTYASIMSLNTRHVLQAGTMRSMGKHDSLANEPPHSADRDVYTGQLHVNKIWRPVSFRNFESFG